jgi:hypothetical protein
MKVAKIICGVLSIVSWTIWYFAWEHYALTSPRTPDQATGQVYPLNTHGSISYLNSGEQHLLWALMASGILFFLATAVLHFSKPHRR